MASVTIHSDFGAQENSLSLLPLFLHLFGMKLWDHMTVLLPKKYLVFPWVQSTCWYTIVNTYKNLVRKILPSFLCTFGGKWGFEKLKNLSKFSQGHLLVDILTHSIVSTPEEGCMCHSRQSGLEPEVQWLVGSEEAISFWCQNWAPSDLLRLVCHQWHLGGGMDSMKPWTHSFWVAPGSPSWGNSPFSEGANRGLSGLPLTPKWPTLGPHSSPETPNPSLLCSFGGPELGTQWGRHQPATGGANFPHHTQ